MPIIGEDRVACLRRDLCPGESYGSSTQGVISILLEQQPVFVELQTEHGIRRRCKCERQIRSVNRSTRHFSIRERRALTRSGKTIEGPNHIRSPWNISVEKRAWVSGVRVIGSARLLQTVPE